MGPLKFIVSMTRNAGAARALEVLGYVLAGAWLIAAFVLIPALSSRLPLAVGERTFGILAAIVLGAVGVSVFGALAELYGQRARDIAANTIFEALARGETPPPYALYLRPFASTNVIARDVGIGITAERIELEGQIERATRPIGRLVALGAPLEHIGAGRIQVPDDQWRDAIHKLLKHARLIVLLPSARAGTLEEIAMILKTDMATRTVLIDPPNLGGSRFDHAGEWAKLQTVFKDAAYELPAEKPSGTLLFYGDQRMPLLHENLNIDAEDRVERLFKRALRHAKRYERRGGRNPREATA